ncbi:hypothetical protein DL766_006773 [Monosporascus sp. MC13-8B]|nr:hypothetical protein DL763_008764 [Monosporascus cannonballus]RYP26280.1 hypothetical protein DL766_006773 [Monosporascus sp. MC13-8B]
MAEIPRKREMTTAGDKEAGQARTLTKELEKLKEAVEQKVGSLMAQVDYLRRRHAKGYRQQVSAVHFRPSHSRTRMPRLACWSRNLLDKRSKLLQKQCTLSTRPSKDSHPAGSDRLDESQRAQWESMDDAEDNFVRMDCCVACDKSTFVCTVAAAIDHSDDSAKTLYFCPNNAQVDDIPAKAAQVQKTMGYEDAEIIHPLKKAAGINDAKFDERLTDEISRLRITSWLYTYSQK